MTHVPPHIKIFPFHAAPEGLAELSTNGGDEDWIAVVPAGFDVPFFLEEGGRFGCCTVEKHEHWSGCKILIGCHA